MSGGSLDSAYYKVEMIADDLQELKGDSPLHRDFIKHLRLIALALHDIEWVMSGDYAEGDDVKAIKKVLKSAK